MAQLFQQQQVDCVQQQAGLRRIYPDISCLSERGRYGQQAHTFAPAGSDLLRFLSLDLQCPRTDHPAGENHTRKTRKSSSKPRKNTCRNARYNGHAESRNLPVCWRDLAIRTGITLGLDIVSKSQQSIICRFLRNCMTRWHL
jgi:hypothetical protein